MKLLDSDDISNEHEYLQGAGRDNGADLICYVCGEDPWWPHVVKVHNLYCTEDDLFGQKQRVLR